MAQSKKSRGGKGRASETVKTVVKVLTDRLHQVKSGISASNENEFN